MRQRIEAMIILVSFAAAAGAHLALLPALIAFEITGHSNTGFWVYVASLAPCSMASIYFFIHVAAVAADMLENEGQITTMASESPPPRKRLKIPMFLLRGKRSPQVDAQLHKMRNGD